MSALDRILAHPGLGAVPDAELAGGLGCSPGYVRRVRIRAGIRGSGRHRRSLELEARLGPLLPATVGELLDALGWAGEAADKRIRRALLRLGASYSRASGVWR